MGSIWIKCSISAALKIIENDKNNKLSIGWCAIKVELLKNRPMQCFKCFAHGHPIQRCPSKIERHTNVPTAVTLITLPMFAKTKLNALFAKNEA